MSTPIFNQIEIKGVGSNTFDLSHDKKLSLNMGELVPICVIDTIPGDNFHINTSQMIRFAPLVAPIMHQVKVYTHYFFVPNRLVWENWQNFITGGEDGLDTSVFPFLQNSIQAKNVGNLSDYMGLPSDQGTLGTQLTNISAIPFAAYQLIYNEYYRDQNLIPKVEYKLSDGLQTITGLRQIRKRAWQHDYFTSALPWTQKGIEATIPLGTTAPLDYVAQGSTRTRVSPGGTLTTGVGGINTTSSAIISGLVSPGVTGTINFDNSEQLRVDLSQATASSINDLRRAFRLQEWLEKNARGGSRYTESILSHFGVKSSDARLQRPEYLGGSQSPVTFSEVLQTSSTGDYAETPQGNMAGHGINVGGSRGIHHYCEEHGYIIGIMSVMPKTSYYQGVPKHFLKFDKFDYFWPSFANLGEQPIQNKEVFLSAALNNMDDTFGYIPRYAEYKYIPDTVHGDFRTSLDFWHMARKFATQPNLNATFITADPREDIFAVTAPGINKLYAHVFNQVKASRKMPVFGTPTI
jgi:hypothetical protein